MEGAGAGRVHTVTGIVAEAWVVNDDEYEIFLFVDGEMKNECKLCVKRSFAQHQVVMVVLL